MNETTNIVVDRFVYYVSNIEYSNLPNIAQYTLILYRHRRIHTRANIDEQLTSPSRQRCCIDMLRVKLGL